MKARLVLAVFAALLLTVSVAVADAIPQVGYSSITVQRGGWVALGIQYDSLDGLPFTAADIIGDQLPLGSCIQVWNPASKKFAKNTYGVSGWPTGDDAIELNRGMGVWVNVPLSAPGTDESFEIHWCGKYPDEGTSTVRLSPGMNMLTYAYPGEIKWLDTDLAATSPNGAMVVYLNPATGAYNSSIRTKGSWSSGSGLAIPEGAAFWYCNPAAGTVAEWVESAPYDVTKLQAAESMDAIMTRVIMNHRYYSSSYYYGSSSSVNPIGSNVAYTAAKKLTRSVQSGRSGDTKYTDTNAQEDGVDEADMVKTDGKYIYQICSGSRLVIYEAYPVGSMKRVSSTYVYKMYPKEMFLHGDRLLVIGSRSGKGYAMLYDVSDRTSPVLKKEVKVAGYSLSSRRIGDYAYIVFNCSIYLKSWGGRFGDGLGDDATIEDMADGVRASFLDWAKDASKSMKTVLTYDGKDVPFSEMGSPSQLPDARATGLMCVLAMNMKTGETDASLLAGSSASKLYCSQDNLYIIERGYYGMSTVHKLHLDRGKVGFVATTTVRGYVNNQFSMDEHDGHLRLATTVSVPTHNNLYVLDREMNVVGTIEKIEPQEQIFAARFMGDRGYLVTFRRIDPLVVLDLSDHSAPKVTGQLEITGFSRYLHPLDDNHLLGIGRDGSSVQLAMFDVTDPKNPKLKYKEVVGRGTTIATSTHKAVTYDAERQLLILPIYLYGTSSYSYYGSSQSFRGAIAFKVSPTTGITEKQRIDHNKKITSYSSSSYYSSYNSNPTIYRSLVIEDVIYTLSKSLLRADSVTSFSELKRVSATASYSYTPPITPPITPIVTPIVIPVIATPSSPTVTPISSTNQPATSTARFSGCRCSICTRSRL